MTTKINYGDGSYFPEAPPPYYQAIQGSPSVPMNYYPPEPRFTYIDFLPDGPGFRYPKLVDKANVWLSQNRNFRLHSCETVPALVKNGAIDNLQSTAHVPANNGRDYVNTLRCWVVKMDSPLDQVQVLKTVARLPERKKGITTISFGNHHHTTLLPSYPFGGMFESLSQCLEKWNAEMEEKPLPGKILKVETIEMKVTETMSAQMNYDPDVLYWTEGIFQTMYANYIRIFYIEGEPVGDQVIGWQDFIPNYIHNPANPQRPKFEPFTQAMYKAGTWAHGQTDKRITNIQTVDIRMTMDPPFPVSTSRPVINSDQTDYYTQGGMFSLNTTLVRVLRVYYVMKPADVEQERPYCLTQRPFLPYRLTPRTFESPDTNIKRLGIWLNCNSVSSGISENDIFCAETIKFQFRTTNPKPIDTECSTYQYLQNTGHFTVSGVRLYLNGMYTEPPIEVIGIPPPVDFSSVQTECCTIL